MNTDGKSASTAFVLSPTVPTIDEPPSKRASAGGGGKGSIDAVGDGSSAKSAVVLSPTVSNTEESSRSARKKAEIRDGKRKCTAIPISPTNTEADPAYCTPDENTCRAMVVSPPPQQNRASGRDSSTRSFSISPSTRAHLQRLGSSRGSPMSVPADVARLVRDLSDSVNKQGVLSRIYGAEPILREGSPLKRKHVSAGSSSPHKKRDNRQGMFTPPSFDLTGDSQETDDVVTNAVPIAWVEAQGGYLSTMFLFYVFPT